MVVSCDINEDTTIFIRLWSKKILSQKINVFNGQRVALIALGVDPICKKYFF